MTGGCCRRLVGILRGVPSPFSRLVATGYYDGPTAGVVECDACKTVYSFHKLDWDDQQDVRVFSLSPIVGARLDDLVRAPGASQPKWPAWVLFAVGGTADLAAHVDELRGSASPEEFIVATEDLLRRLEVWRPVGLGTHEDWFRELELTR